MTDPKRPTVSDVSNLISFVNEGMWERLKKCEAQSTSPDSVWDEWARFTVVLEYADACLRAEEEAERVLEDRHRAESRTGGPATGFLYGERPPQPADWGEE